MSLERLANKVGSVDVIPVSSLSSVKKKKKRFFTCCELVEHSLTRLHYPELETHETCRYRRELSNSRLVK